MVMTVRRSVVVLSLVLALTGLLTVLTIESHLGLHSMSVKDLSFSGSCSHSIDSFGQGLNLGTMTLSSSGAGLSIALTGVTFVIGTVAIDARSEEPQSLRERIIATIGENPGIHLRELLRNVGCAMGALQYHLKHLEKNGVVVSIRSGNSKHFFPSGFSSDTKVMRLAAMLRNPTIRAIIEECQQAGRVTQADLSRTLSLDKSLVSYYANSLVKAGFLKTIPVFGRERPLALTDFTIDTLSEFGLMQA